MLRLRPIFAAALSVLIFPSQPPSAKHLQDIQIASSRPQSIRVRADDGDRGAEDSPGNDRVHAKTRLRLCLASRYVCGALFSESL
jgi:hypothetical protein